MTGLGTMFTSDSAKLRVTRAVLTQVLCRLLRRSRSAVLVQNGDDYAMIQRLGVDRRHITVIPGSGVDTDAMMLRRSRRVRSRSPSSAGWWSRRGFARYSPRISACRNAAGISGC
jgi:hypothetical protein